MTGDVHTYRTRLEWEGSTAAGYDHYDRRHRLWAVTDRGRVASGGADGLVLSSDPAFLGDPALLNPEQLMLAAASSCHALSFLAVVARRRLDVVAYTDDATATMPEADRPVRITAIVLHPHVTIRVPVGEAEPRDDELDKLHSKAHHVCYVANSVTTTITVEATFTVVQ